MAEPGDRAEKIEKPVLPLRDELPNPPPGLRQSLNWLLLTKVA